MKIGDLSVAYRDAGSGGPLVLLHGFLCDSRCWRLQLEGLSDDFRVIAWDAPGAGMSSDPPHECTLTDWARILAKMLDALNIDAANVLGLSWGGVLAQEFYRVFPERVSRLILSGTYAGWKGSLPADVVEQRLSRCMRDSNLTPDQLAKSWVPEMFSPNVSPQLIDELSAIFADFHPRGFRAMAKALASTDTTQLLRTIHVPTLLLWGTEDSRSPVAIAQQMRGELQSSTMSLIPEAGHISNMERPAEFNAHVRWFLPGSVSSVGYRL